MRRWWRRREQDNLQSSLSREEVVDGSIPDKLVLRATNSIVVSSMAYACEHH